jgi:hypothetical protein
LYIDGLPDPIGTTPNHPIWSVDRGNFVRAEELQIGERLQGDRGPLALNAIEKNQGSEPVFNLEIFGQHVFRVSSLGVLAHNNDECFEFVTLADGSTVKRFKLEIEPGIVIRPGVNTSLPLRVTGELPVGQMRTPEEVKQARNFFERNRDAAKKWYEERTGRPWPQNATHAEHPRALKDGGDPLLIEPGFNGPDAPHMIPGQDGLTDFQRWGRLGGRPPNK